MEFIDKKRLDVMDDYYNILEEMKSDRTLASLEKKLESLIKRDPDFFDSYSVLYDLLCEHKQYQKAVDVLTKGYKRAIAVITDKKGNWPTSLEWGWHENRHIIRVILNYGILAWTLDKSDEALDLFRKLLNSNPNDNVGVRNYILAIREGMTFSEYESRFNKGGYYDMESVDWFDESKNKYPEEFQMLGEY